ncbi:MAG: IS481 family transposase, partial [Gaiellaceae bacterium]
MNELKLEVLLEPDRTGDSVAEVCRRRGISRASYYRYRRRYLEEGGGGLEPRSRRPRRSPGRIEAELEATIVTLRKRHRRWGARRIHAELARAGIEPPAVATIHRALKRNYLVAPQPPRPRKATRRFERELPNDLWQIDGTQVKLASGERAWVVDCLDDHARFLLAALACASPTGEAAWVCFLAASSAHGLPRQLLSDNHTSFTGRLFGVTVAFERKLAQLGVELINAAPAHPQTLGKLERFHRTLKDWLEDEGPALDLEHLQLLLDRFRSHYNQERPHQGIGDATPAERYLPGPPPVAPLGELALAEAERRPDYPPHSLLRKVWQNGVVSYDGMAITLGKRYAGALVRIVEVGELVHAYLGDELIRALAPDRTKRCQKLGKPPRRR